MAVTPAEERRRGERRVRDDRRVWRLLKRDRRLSERRRAGPVDASANGPADVARTAPAERAARVAPSATRRPPRGGDDPELRRARLRAMLEVAEARTARASQSRRTPLAAGVVVRVTRGELRGRTAVIVDADYIDSRALLDIGPDAEPLWVPFAQVEVVPA